MNRANSHKMVTPTKLFDFAIIGGDLVGLSVALALTDRFPRARIVVLETESEWGTARGGGGGVLHSGITCAPGSLQAVAAREGNKAMTRFCEAHGIPYELCGKLIVATDPGELAHLDEIHRRGLASGLKVLKMSGAELRAIEPHVDGLAAVHVQDTGIIDFRRVAQTMAYCLNSKGRDLRLGTRAEKVIKDNGRVVIETSNEPVHSRFLINCAGPRTNPIAHAENLKSTVRIVPLRGERYALRPEKRSLINHLVYPVPNGGLPFQGVHFTRSFNGDILAGSTPAWPILPGGARKADRYLRDFLNVASEHAVWSVTRRHFAAGTKNMMRSWGKSAFIHSLQKLVPELTPGDLIPTKSGTSGHALLVDGYPVDDFVVIRGDSSLHIYSASPLAATCALEIGEMIAARVD